MKEFRCAQCGKAASRETGHVNRARAQGLNLYCSRVCSGLGRRKNKSVAQRKEEKRLYDIQYRKRNLKRILASKKEYFRRTYDPVAAAAERAKRMHIHVAYCRRPEYREKKSAYDKHRRATNERARLKLPQSFPDELVTAVKLVKQLYKESTK